MINSRILRTVVVILAAVLLFSLCACAGPEETKTPDPTGGTIVLETPSEGSEKGTPGDIDQSPEAETSAPTAEETPAEIPTATPTAAPTAAPTEVPTGEVFIDLEKVKTFYVIPGSEYTFDFGDTSGWSIDTRGVMNASFSGSKLIVKADKTGYAKLTGPGGGVGYIYSNLAVERTENRKAESGFPYYIYYEKGRHVMTIYTADDKGYYTVPVRTISAASGSTPAKTPVGMFKLGAKMRWKVFGANCHAQYGIEYSSGVFLHGPCYSEQRENSIISYYYNSIGDSSTGGCLRMQTGNIYWVYKNCDTGTKLEIVDGSPRGLDCERPAEIPESACYDPTDPALNRR